MNRSEPSVSIRLDPDTRRRLSMAAGLARIEGTTIREIASDALDAWLDHYDVPDPTEPPPEADGTFRAELDAAYDQLSAELRTRFVPLSRLRAATPAWERETFDRELVALCRADRFQLSEHEHPWRLTPAERLAALEWADRKYYFVSRV